MVFANSQLTLVVQHVVEAIEAIAATDPAVGGMLEYGIELHSFVCGDNLLVDDLHRRVLLQVGQSFCIAFLQQGLLDTHRMILSFHNLHRAQLGQLYAAFRMNDKCAVLDRRLFPGFVYFVTSSKARENNPH